MSQATAPNEALGAGFANPALESQRVFRAILDAMARPGSVLNLASVPSAPGPLDGAAAAICLCLADLDTPVWLDAAARPAASFLRFHTGCPITEQPDKSVFAVIAEPSTIADLQAFAQGDPGFPERSTTLIMQVSALAQGSGWVLSGPGIDGTARLSVAGLHPAFAESWRANGDRFPCGVDVILTAGDCVAALPRTTRMEG